MSTILIADDDNVLRDLYRLVLVRSGFIVHEAKDGLAAIESVKNNQIDLILLDVMMPKLNGIDVLKLLKSESATKKIPVIIITALNYDLNQLHQVVSQAEFCFAKADMTPKLLIEKISNALEKANT